MTDYLLPEGDRIAPFFNPLLEGFADLEAETAECVALGATTVIGLISESVTDLNEYVVGQAAAMGVSREEAETHVEVVFEKFFSIMQPRLDAMREALASTQEEDEEEPANPAEALLAALSEALGIDLSDFDSVEIVAEDAEDDGYDYEEDALADWERELLGL